MTVRCRNACFVAATMALICMTLPGMAQTTKSSSPPAKSGAAKSAMAEWEAFDYKTQLVKPEQLADLSLPTLQKIRGIVFGRHRRIFKEPIIQNYLETRSWYEPSSRFTNADLNATERQNLDVIRGAEAKKHPHIQPGDLRFYETHAFTLAELGKPSLSDLHIMQEEIEAIHGRRFEAEPLMQTYFSERYWYKPDPNYRASQLSEVERKNLATLREAEKSQRGLKLAPGDMLAFQNRPITPALLDGLSLYELRLLRNEVYARRGQNFRIAWLSDYFSTQEWYKPHEDFNPVPLSPTEQANVATIVARENALHDSLSVKPIAPSLLKGLGAQDASRLRNEIAARHGRVFKTKWLQDYFAGQKWYKPNPNFREAGLSSTEKRNMAMIAAYERSAEKKIERVEA